MTALGLAWRNVSRSFTSYAFHFLSIALNVFVFYLFDSSRHDPTIKAIVDLNAAYGLGMLVAAGVIAVFAAVFLWHSTSFFLRRRSRELGLYVLFGVPSARVSFAFFAETMISGLFALALGLGAGIPCGKLFLMTVLRILGVDAAVGFSVQPAAVADTCAVFAGLLAVASAAAAWRVYRFRLVDSFRAERQREALPRRALVLGALGALVIAAGYALAATTTGANLGTNFLVVSLLTVAGTWGFARGGAGLVVRALKTSSRITASGPRLLALGDLTFRVGSYARVVFAIAIASTVSMVALGVGSNLKASLSFELERATAFTMSYSGSLPIDGAKAALEANGARVTATGEARVLNAEWVNRDVRGADYNPKNVRVFPADDYLALLAGRDRTDASALLSSLPDGAMAVVEYLDDRAASFLRSDYSIRFVGADEARDGLRVAGRLPKPGISQTPGCLTLVAPQGYFDALAADYPDALGWFRGVSIADPRRGAAAAKALEATAGVEDFLSVTRWLEIIRIYDLIFFVGLLIGLVFLFSSCSILHFKQLMDAADDERRHEILFKIGLSRADARRLARFKVLPTYALPLGLACLHSVVALSVMGRVMDERFGVQILCVVSAFALAFLAFGAMTTRATYALMTRHAPAEAPT